MIGSGADPQGFTETLGEQLRRAVELLLAALGRADRRRAAGRPGLAGVPVDEIYRGVVTVVMRMLVLVVAEQRGLFPGQPELPCSTEQLQAELGGRPAGPADPTDEGSGWRRLRALCGAVHEHIEASAPSTVSQVTALFDPSAYPWLSLPVDDHTVAQLLLAVRGPAPGWALGIEQVGHGYERLLSLGAVRSDTVMIGLVGRAGRERQVPLTELVELATRPGHPLPPAIAATAPGRSAGPGSPARLARNGGPLYPAEREGARAALLAATGDDVELVERLLPFDRLIRRDLGGGPVVTLPGAPGLAGSGLRRSTGTHYTPQELAAQVVRHALQPLLYHVGPLQTADRRRWVPKSSAELLQLRVVDIAMGSGAFLVAAARYLAGPLLLAWRREGRASDEVEARRLVVERCLFGVDINPMAVQIAKLSLWLLVGDPARPVSGLDDRLVAGDALLGITDIDQPASLVERSGWEELGGSVAGIAEVRRRDPADPVTARPPRTVRATLEEDRRRAQLVADLAVGAALTARIRLPRGRGAAPGGVTLRQGRGRRPALARECAALVRQVLAGADPTEAARRSRQWLDSDRVPGTFERRPVHWPLLFPEVFERGGFDAVIGNPPFLGGQRLTGALGRAYRELLVDTVGNGVRGSADLVAYFLLRAHELLGRDGQTGLLATNTLAQGDTRELGLDRLVAGGVTLRRAVRSAPWPTRYAALEYCAVWTSRAPLTVAAERCLDGRVVPAITSALLATERAGAGPRRLAGNAGRCFIGSYVLGLGFTMPPERAKELLAADPHHADVLFPYLSGRDLNGDPATAASRWVINFHDWPEDRARHYPQCYQRVRELVKPERDRNHRAVYRRYWWQYAEKRPALATAIAGLSRVVVIALISRTAMPVLVPTGQVLSHKLGVFASDDPALLALLSSAPHYWWTRCRTSTIKTDLNYSPSDVFETLPVPELTPELHALGGRLDEYRRHLMRHRRIGLTPAYNLVGDSAVQDADVAELRRIHRAVDRAALRAYGWPDLLDRLDHGFHDVGRERRYTIGPLARREIQDRLLGLNHERHAAENGGSL